MKYSKTAEESLPPAAFIFAIFQYQDIPALRHVLAYSLPYKPNEYERTGRIMKILRKIKGKLPVVVTLCCCIAVAGLSALVNGEEKAVEVASGASLKQVVIIDAGKVR